LIKGSGKGAVMVFKKTTSEQVLKIREVEGFPMLVYPLLEQIGMVKHCFTTRQGGVSEGIFESLNLSFTRGDSRAAVEENFRRVAKALGTEYEKICVHRPDPYHQCKACRAGRCRERTDQRTGLYGRGWTYYQ